MAPTTTTVPPVSPLTGLPQPNAAQLQAPAVVVKIDNIDNARPQTGIASADVVYEEQVEGGLTRLAAVFQSTYPTTVGPIRSGRLTDEGIGDDLNHPVYVMSGTNAIFLPQLRAQPWTDVDDTNHGEQFYRGGSRPAPDNLYGNVAAIAKLSTTHTPPAPLFQYRAAGSPFNGAGVTAANHLNFALPNASVAWSYSPQFGQWVRTQNGTADVDSSGRQLSATNIVVLFINYVVTGMATGEGVPATPIPGGIMTGTGQALFLSGNQVVKGTWNRTSLTSPATYADGSGAPIQLAAGNTWVELLPIGNVPSVTP